MYDRREREREKERERERVLRMKEIERVLRMKEIERVLRGEIYCREGHNAIIQRGLSAGYMFLWSFL